MITYFWIAIGSALGGMARFAVSSTFAKVVGEAFPWGTLVVNISGCFLIGILSALTGADARVVVAPDFRQFLLVGICGGYTTFSSFSLQTLNLLRDGEFTSAAGNTFASVLVCLIASWIGMVAGQALNQVRAG